jgi:two-component sensor histidine kinase
MTAPTSQAPAASRSAWQRWTDISTEIKIFLALLIGLAPLGILGVTATISGTKNAERDRTSLIRVAGNEMSRNLGTGLAADRAVVRRSLVGIAVDDLFPEEARRICNDLRIALRQADVSAPRIYIASPAFSRELCPSGGASYLDGDAVPKVPVEGLLGIDQATGRLVSSVRFDEQEAPYAAVLSYNSEALAAIAEDDIANLPTHDLAIAGSDGRIAVREDLGTELPGMTQTIQRPIGQSGHSLVMTTYRAAFTGNELVSLLSPIAIWVAGAVLSWALLGFFIMRPLSRLHRSVAAYRPGAVFQRPRRFQATAREIVQLEEDFSALSETVAADKAELAKGLERQTALTREVHHRVKNNLQVIGSLISLHSRSATTDEAKRAYRTIQRRVDAISVVHRNHFAGSEGTVGHALRPLLSELASNLRASGHDPGGFPQISVSVDEIYVSQDVAVPIAFLVTELAELSSVCDASQPIAIAVERSATDPTLAVLTIESAGLAGCEKFNALMVSRYERIMTGLSRQLRKPFVHDPGTGRYAIELTVLPKA